MFFYKFNMKPLEAHSKLIIENRSKERRAVSSKNTNTHAHEHTHTRVGTRGSYANINVKLEEVNFETIKFTKYILYGHI